MTALELRNQLFSQALGAYSHQGFNLKETEDTIDLYCHSCGLVDHFTPYATFKALQGGCEAHQLKAHGISYSHSLDSIRGELCQM
jgi:hypothetical protein